MELRVKAKKIGGSIAVIIPKEIVDTQHIKENDELSLEVEKITNSGDIFGKFKTGQSAQKSKNEIRKELWGIE